MVDSDEVLADDGEFTALVEEHLASVLSGLSAVAVTEEAASGNWDRLCAWIRR